MQKQTKNNNKSKRFNKSKKNTKTKKNLKKNYKKKTIRFQQGGDGTFIIDEAFLNKIFDPIVTERKANLKYNSNKTLTYKRFSSKTIFTHMFSENSDIYKQDPTEIIIRYTIVKDLKLNASQSDTFYIQLLKALFQYAESHPNLVSLNLSNNNMTDSELFIITQHYLKNNKTIKELDISSNNIMDSGINILASTLRNMLANTVIKGNGTLIMIKIFDNKNPIKKDTKENLVDKINLNRRIGPNSLNQNVFIPLDTDDIFNDKSTKAPF